MKKRELGSRFSICVGIFASILFWTDLLYADSLVPININAKLRQGQCIQETKTVTLEGSPASVDIMFSFNLSISMTGILHTAKTEAINIMTAIKAALPSSTIRFGVVSYMDYPHLYGNDGGNCGYYNFYGDPYSGDYAYSLDRALTDNTAAVSAAINGLGVGFGYDSPQDYTRIFYESYADGTNIGWSEGVKIWINFGDNVPHDCNLNEGVPGVSGIWNTGRDPGRDEIMGTADDLDLQTVLRGMAENHIILMELHTTSNASAHWTYWTGLTGGSLFKTGSSGSGLIDRIVAAVNQAVRNINNLTLKASAGYEDWLTSVVPSGYTGIHAPGASSGFEFEIQICVPKDANCGVHKFTVNAVGDGSVLAGQDVSIDVPCRLLGSRLEFDAVGCDATNYFNDFIRTAVCDNGNIVNEAGEIIAINEHSNFTGPLGESFTTNAGQLWPDPCFNNMRTGCVYESALTVPWTEEVYTWVIVLQKKPEGDMYLDIRNCVLKPKGFDVWTECDQTGLYKAPWDQVFFIPSANPSISVTALPGPFATAGFPNTGFGLDARQTPGLDLVALEDTLYPGKCLWENSIVLKLPVTGGTNVIGQTEYELKQGDRIRVVVGTPENNAVNLSYGKDNVSIKYKGKDESEYVTTDRPCGICGECAGAE